MELAITYAKKAFAMNEVPVGAVLVCDNNLISASFNQRETLKRTTAHAEILALDNYNIKYKEWRLPPNTSIFVTVEPCIMCTSALLSARIENIYYGCYDTKNAGIRCISAIIKENKFDHIPKEILGGILEKECGELLSSFFSLKHHK